MASQPKIKPMLVDFTVGNFRSFGERQTLSMIASNDPLMASHVISDETVLKRKNIKLLRTAVIYGANASGKSNLCAALKCMAWLVAYSATKLNHGDVLKDIEPFRLDVSEKKPSFFEARILIEGSIYRYGFEATRSQIQREWLYVTGARPRSKEVLLFDREGGTANLWRFGGALKGRTRILMEETRESNCLLLSKSAQNNFLQTLGIYNWFRNSIVVSDGTLTTEGLESWVLRALRGQPVPILTRETVGHLMQVADNGIMDVHVDFGAATLVGDPTDDFGQHVQHEHKLKFFRETHLSGKPRSFDIEEESSGTRRFLEMALLVMYGVEAGSVVFVDELESSLHPLLSREIIDVMNDPSLGSGSAQFIVTTHDSNLLDHDLLRRDQIWFMEKGVDNQTEHFSLYDLKEKPKPDAALERQYLASRFGGVPTVGNLRLAIANAIRNYHERSHPTISAQK